MREAKGWGRVCVYGEVPLVYPVRPTLPRSTIAAVAAGTLRAVDTPPAPVHAPAAPVPVRVEAGNNIRCKRQELPAHFQPTDGFPQPFDPCFDLFLRL